MPIEVSTVYTKERTLRFSDFIALSRKFYWTFMAICLPILAGLIAWLIYWDALTWQLAVYASLCPVLVLIRVIFWFVVPRFAIKKNKSLNMTVTYTFDTDCFRTHSYNSYTEGDATVQYSTIEKIKNNKTDLYIFTGKYQAGIVDLTALSPEQVTTLRNLLTEKVDPKKVTWKD